MHERLILVTDVEVAGGVDAMCDRLAAAVAAAPGRLLVELRDKHMMKEARAELARRVATICHSAGTRWVVNGSAELAVELGADGVHLPELGADPAAARAALPHGAMVGVSTHSVASARQHGPADYVLLGPIWPTASKPGMTPLGVEVLAGLPRVLAIGGVDDAARARAARLAGAHGVAVIRAILAAADPGAATAALVAAVEQA